MKIKIYGSGGGESLPGSFCTCEHCRRAKELGGKNIKSLSQTVIDDFLLLDLGPDTSRHVHAGLPLSEIGGVLFTHSHNDHCYPQILENRGGCFASGMKYPVLDIYGNEAVVEKTEREMSYFEQVVLDGLALHTVEPWQQFRVGEYQIWTLAAMHAPKEKALNYAISDGTHTVLYALDTGKPLKQYFEFLCHKVPTLDCVIMDCTMGIKESGWIYHMGICQNIDMKLRMEQEGLVKKDCLFYATHFTHNYYTDHEDMEKRLQKAGIGAAYDGLTIQL